MGAGSPCYGLFLGLPGTSGAEILAAAGLTEADLQNTPDLPYDPQERDGWLATGQTPLPIAQNCSGKHAAMLATCRIAGWDAATYRDPDHPLQQLMAAAANAGHEIEVCDSVELAAAEAMTALPVAPEPVKNRWSKGNCENWMPTVPVSSKKLSFSFGK